MPLRATVKFVQATAQDYHIRSQSFDNPFYFDTVTLSDVIGVAFITAKADNFSFTDVQLFDLNKGLTDNFGFSDVVTTAVQYFDTYTDSYTLGDVVSSLIELDRPETITLSEIVSVALNIPAVTDGVTLGDLIGALVSKTKLDNVSISDETVLHPNKQVPDGVSINETNIRSIDVGKLNVVSFSDTPLLQYNYVFADAFVMDDTAQVDKDYISFKENVLGFSDTISIDSIHGRALGGMVLGSKQFN
tara:strand:+ start:396 stop:1133 length:738 start_codon:yes stop_codon:yes gene_type:complete